MKTSYQELANQRYDALLRQNPAIALSWARSQTFAHVFLAQLEDLGWSEEDRIRALQEMHRCIWAQINGRNL